VKNPTEHQYNLDTGLDTRIGGRPGGLVVAHEAQRWICKRCSGPGTDSKGISERRICISFICDKFCRHCRQGDQDKEEDCVRVKSGQEFPLWDWKISQPDHERFKAWALILERKRAEERLKSNVFDKVTRN
jgi:hypothetical protein